MNTSPLTAGFQVSLRAAAASGIALALAQALRLDFPIYAMISAVLVTDLESSQTWKLALPRLVGTVFGATLGAAICSLTRPNTWGIAAGIMAAMFLSHLLGLRDTAKLAGYVCGIVLLDHGDGPWAYALLRTVETGLGIAAAIAVSLVPKLLPSDSGRRE